MQNSLLKCVANRPDSAVPNTSKVCRESPRGFPSAKNVSKVITNRPDSAFLSVFKGAPIVYHDESTGSY